MSLLPQFPPGYIGVISISRWRGQTAGWVYPARNTVEPLHALRLVGPGMHTIPTVAGQTQVEETAITAIERERWSRVIGALGEEVWWRILALRYGIVGVGRIGSIMATSLAKLGVRQITLFDLDKIEHANLDSMNGVTSWVEKCYTMRHVSFALSPLEYENSVFALS